MTPGGPASSSLSPLQASYFGVVAHSRPGCAGSGDGAEADAASICNPPDGCYVLKLSRVPGEACTAHYSLTKVCSHQMLHAQLQESWLVQALPV